MNRKRWITTAAVIVLFCGALAYYNFYYDRPDSAEDAGPAAPRSRSILNVNGLIIRPQTLTDGITTIGNLLPDEEVDLSFETSGKIVAINFQEGTTVRKGELLAKVNDRPLQAQLSRYEAQRELAEALRAEAAKLKYDNESLNSRIELLTAEKEAKDKYKGSRLEQKDYEKIFYSLCRYLQHEKPYLNPDLKISEVAKAIGSTSANMSQFFTLYLNRSYHEFINSYRLEEFKSRIQDPKYKNYTITAVSEMCGFRKSSFFTTFKSQEGCTPSEYMERIGIKAGVQNGADEDPEKLPDADAEKPDDGRNDGE